MDVGAVIRFWRNSLGYTQVQLAEKAKISRSYLAGIENGAYNPSLDTLDNLANALGMTSSELLGTQKENASSGSGERTISDSELKFALWGDCEDITDSDLADVRRYAAFLRERKKETK